MKTEYYREIYKPFPAIYYNGDNGDEVIDFLKNHYWDMDNDGIDITNLHIPRFQWILIKNSSVILLSRDDFVERYQIDMN